MTKGATVAELAENSADAVIRVNGREEKLSAPTLAALLAQRDGLLEMRGVAVALNGEVVPRAGWPTTKLRAGDILEIVLARQGG